MTDPDVVIVGAGLAGLSCGRRLAQCGVSFLILEAADEVGGRVRSDLVEGFTLDRGFQFYLTAFPEGRRILDLAELRLRSFTRSVLIRFDGRFHRVPFPLSSPVGAARSLLSPIGSPADKFRMAHLAWLLNRGPLEDIESTDELLTLDFLRSVGKLGQSGIDRLFRPLFGGVFLERDLATSSRFFRFVFRMLVDGAAAIPATGMQAIPRQLADRLPVGSIRVNTKVQEIRNGEVGLACGDAIRSRALVVATGSSEARALTDGEVECPGWNGTTTLYFTAQKSPVGEPTLVLDGEGQGPVNHLAALSDVAPEYAPLGESLIAVSTVGVPPEGDETLESRVREQMTSWFGESVQAWRHLRTYRIPHALPNQTAGRLDPWRRPVRLRPGLYVCGGHRDNASIDGAMTSGFRAAQAVMEDLAAKRA